MELKDNDIGKASAASGESKKAYGNPYKKDVILFASIFAVSLFAFFATKTVDLLKFPVLYAMSAYTFGALTLRAILWYRHYEKHGAPLALDRVLYEQYYREYRHLRNKQKYDGSLEQYLKEHINGS